MTPEVAQWWGDPRREFEGLRAEAFEIGRAKKSVRPPGPMGRMGRAHPAGFPFPSVAFSAPTMPSGAK